MIQNNLDVKFTFKHHKNMQLQFETCDAFNINICNAAKVLKSLSVKFVHARTQVATTAV